MFVPSIPKCRTADFEIISQSIAGTVHNHNQDVFELDERQQKYAIQR